MNSTKFLKEKQFLDYYKGHYLESVAKLYVGNIYINDTEKLFRYSKNVKNNKDRKKLLHTIYNEIQKTNPLFTIDRLSLLLVHNRMSVSAFNEFAKYDSFDNIEEIKDIDYINEYGDPSIHITRLKDVQTIIKDISVNFQYPKSLSAINSLNNYNITMVKNGDNLKKIASIYENCWSTHIHECAKGEFYLMDVTKKENDELLGTIRFHSPLGKLNVAGWITPKDNDPEFQYWQFSKKLLKTFIKDLYKQTQDETFNPKNIEFELHYGDKRGKFTDSLENKYKTGTIAKKTISI